MYSAHFTSTAKTGQKLLGKSPAHLDSENSSQLNASQKYSSLALTEYGRLIQKGS